VKAAFAGENRQNIAAVMAELRANRTDDVRYAAYVAADGVTFMHLVHQRSTEAEALPTSLSSFKHFQARLKENLEVPPKVEQLTLVDSAVPIF
jgi:hypothetical protein